MHFFTVIEGDQTLALEPVDHLGYGRCGEAQELGEPRRDDMSVLICQRVDRLEVLLDGRRSGDC
jgi:hypothetical protein